jgi:hypothetical protein
VWGEQAERVAARLCNKGDFSRGDRHAGDPHLEPVPRAPSSASSRLPSTSSARRYCSATFRSSVTRWRRPGSSGDSGLVVCSRAVQKQTEPRSAAEVPSESYSIVDALSPSLSPKLQGREAPRPPQTTPQSA